MLAPILLLGACSARAVGAQFWRAVGVGQFWRLRWGRPHHTAGIVMGCRPGTQTFGDQLGRAKAGSWQIADGSDLRTARAEVTSVGDLRLRSVVEP
eukprot:scaffold20973_cov53-Phaeocystis_antarctica.AAC.2